MARGARVDEADANGETLLSVFAVQLANVSNYKTAARCLDVLFNEFEDEAFDFDCPDRHGFSLEERVFRADNAYGDRALRMVQFIRSIWDVSEGNSSVGSSGTDSVDSQVERVRSELARTYSVGG